MSDRSIVAALFKNGESHPDKLAVTTGAEPNVLRVSYGGLLEKIRKVAALLLQKGVKQDDCIILSASQSPSFVYAYFATHFVGATAVPVDPQVSSTQLSFIARATDARTAFLSKYVAVKGVSDVALIDSLLELENEPVGLKTIPLPKLSDRADILFTTGTTGAPKGVVLTHRNILASANNINTFIQNTSKDLELIPLPLSHSFGLGRLRCNFLLGASIALANGFSLPGKIFRQLTETKASGISFVPAGAAVLFKFGEEKLGNFRDQLRYIEIGSAPMPLEHKQMLMELLPKTRICMHYGLTEASRSSFLEFHKDSEHLASIGRATPGVSIQVQDERGRPCQTGVCGSIRVRGSSVTEKYLTSENFPLTNGWFTTGDLGYQDEEGYLYLEGRESDLINVGGRKVSPLELETLLSKLQSVKEVACVGMADPNGISGEVVKVFLVPKPQGFDGLKRPTHSDLVGYLRNKVEPYKIPFKFEWIERLPKTSSGKIQRKLLKKKSEKL